MLLEMLWQITKGHFDLATVLLEILCPPSKLNSILKTVIITMENSVALFTSGTQSAW